MNDTINIELIENYLNAFKITKSEFCKRAKISYSVLTKIYNNQINFRINALFKICRTIGINLYQIFKD